MFFKEYTLFGSTVVGKEILTTVDFKLETKIYDYVKRIFQKDQWKYLRVDTQNQIGFPDVLLLKEATYWQIEAKLLKKKQLKDIASDLRWEYGQLAYFKRALTLNLNYMLAVAKKDRIIFFKGVSNERQCPDYPYPIRCI